MRDEVCHQERLLTTPLGSIGLSVLPKSFTPGLANVAIASQGHQTVSYGLRDPFTVHQRVDRVSVLGVYWTFYHPDLEGVDTWLIVRSGIHASAKGITS